MILILQREERYSSRDNDAGRHQATEEEGAAR